MTRIDPNRLQDYLDGRLSDRDRAAFEAELRVDERLAAIVSAAREARQALRCELPQPSPGFYARARTRFENAYRPPRRWNSRLLSWEAVGLAAAAVLILVLFLPPSRRPTPAPAADEVESLADKQVAPPAVGRAAPTEEPGGRGPAPGARQMAETDSAERRAPALDDSGAALERLRPAETAKAETARRSTVAVSVPRQATPEPIDELAAAGSEVLDERRDAGLQKALSDRASGENEVRPAESAPAAPTAQPSANVESGRWSPVPARAEGSLASGGEDHDGNLQARLGAASSEEKDDLSRKRATPPDVHLSPVELRAAPLRPGLASPGEVREILDRAEWQAVLEADEPALASLLAWDVGSRLVLLGPRDRMSCESLGVSTIDGAYLVVAAPSPGGRRAEGGCALLLPRDGRLVRVIDAPPPETR